MILDVLAYKGSLRAMVALAEAHPKPLNMTAFAYAVRGSSDIAANVRERLVAGVLIIVEPNGFRGPVQVLRISLTPKGERAARHLVAMYREESP